MKWHLIGDRIAIPDRLTMPRLRFINFVGFVILLTVSIDGNQFGFGDQTATDTTI